MTAYTDLFRKTKRIGSTRWQMMAQFSRMRVVGLGFGWRANVDSDLRERTEYKLTLHVFGYALTIGVEMTTEALRALCDSAEWEAANG